MQKKEIERIRYDMFVVEWNKKHTISKAPSFTSWKKNYKNDVKHTK